MLQSAHRHFHGSLPLRSLDRLTLQNKLKDIGRTLMPSLARRYVAECLGTAFLLAGVVGSGIMAAKLAGGNVALALLCNTIPTGAILVVLILIFGPLSGAHFNPAVSLAFALRRELPWAVAAAYIAAQDRRRHYRRVGGASRCSNCRCGRSRSRRGRVPANGLRKASPPSDCC